MSVVFSHSNPKALVDHDRNITDDQIKACADTGGVIGINGINLFLGETEARPKPVARHIAYVAELVGPDHVGISLDYAGYDDTVGCLHVRRLPDVSAELVALGFTEPDIAGVLGGDFKRVAKQVWK